MPAMDFARVVPAARERIRAHVRHTPTEPSPWLGAGAADVHLKLENHQLTGSFKLRGALSRLTLLDADERRRGVVAASTGNHGAAVACGAALVGTSATIYAPETAAASKLDAVRARGAEVRLVGADCVEAEAAARAAAEETGATYVSPYNDPAVVAGQGTLGLELDEDLGPLDAVFVSVGGGGLISGVGGVLKALGRDVEVVGCSPRNSAVMHASLEAGRLLDLPSLPTLSDGTAGGVEPGAITFELCRDLIDRFVLVEEAPIAQAMRELLARHHALVEGAAAVAVAAFLAQRERYAGKRVAIVLCGANVDPRALRAVLDAG
jgi:threonine dehydratase